MIVRWGVSALSYLLDELSIKSPLLITTRRWANIELGIARRFDGVLPHAELTGVAGAFAALEGVDGLVALGGGSAIDTTKAVSAQTGLAVISIPTTYAGAEWTPFFGVRNPATKSKDSGAGAQVRAIIYDTELTLGLPPDETAGTALNALAHCAEALYTKGRTDDTDNEALGGAGLISTFLPVVMDDLRSVPARRGLLEGAMHAGSALRAGMGIGHAMAQALGGQFGLPHGAMNAICLPLAMRFNIEVAPRAMAYLAAAMGTQDAIGRTKELAGLLSETRLRDYGVAKSELAQVARSAAGRPAAKTNPRPASESAVLEMMESAW